jgi:hypothetical protein
MKSIRPKPQKLDPSTRFKDGPDSINRRTISDFWQWAYSDLMQNVERAVLAEYIVAALIGVGNKLRVPWLAYDLKLPNGKTVEVKTMSKLQAWYQRRLSSPRVVIKPTRKWDPKTGVMEKEPKLHADLYVICYFNADSHDLADPLNLAQWEFYAFNRKQVEKMLEGRKSISLKYLEKLGINPIKAHELREHILRNSE